MKISIVIPTYNNVNFMDWALRALRKNTVSPLEILVHGNCSGQDLRDVCKKWDVDWYQSSPNNLGIAVPTNQLAKKSTGDIIMYSNDDIYVAPEWDTPLLAKLNPDIFYQYLTPVMFERQWSNPSMNAPNDFGDTPETFREEEFITTWRERRRIKQDIISTWGPPFLKRELWFHVGGFCEDYFPGWGTDSDIIAQIYNRAQRSGSRFEFRGVADCGIYHIQSVGLGKIKPQESSAYQSYAMNLFRRKWGIDTMDLYNKIGTGKTI